MPIDYKEYPENWKDEIRPQILKRDGYKCKMCGVRQRAVGYRDSKGKFVECDEFLERWAKTNGKKVIKIHLQVMHLDHDVSNNEGYNLLSGCQQCHNRYDAKNRAFKRIKHK
jgi:hypothetical protein